MRYRLGPAFAGVTRPDRRRVKLLAADAHQGRGVDADSHPAAFHLQDHKGDVAADTDLFTGLPAEDQHGHLLLEKHFLLTPCLSGVLTNLLYPITIRGIIEDSPLNHRENQCMLARMAWLNYHHLLYFWTVAREGSIARACRRLHLTQ